MAMLVITRWYMFFLLRRPRVSDNILRRRCIAMGTATGTATDAAAAATMIKAPGRLPRADCRDLVAGAPKMWPF
jgi:hypothetical protein